MREIDSLLRDSVLLNFTIMNELRDANSIFDNFFKFWLAMSIKSIKLKDSYHV